MLEFKILKKPRNLSHIFIKIKTSLSFEKIISTRLSWPEISKIFKLGWAFGNSDVTRVATQKVQKKSLRKVAIIIYACLHLCMQSDNNLSTNIIDILVDFD